MKSVVVIPAYNEANTVGGVARSLLGRVDGIVVVDDGSVDDTARLARIAGAEVVTHVINRGLGAAIGTGLALALAQGADVIITFDADGQHQAEDIARMLAPLLAGEADITIGTRTLDRQLMPASRRLANWIGNALTFILFGLWVKDSQSGLRAFTRETAQRLELRCDRMEVSSEIVREIRRNQLRLIEIPIQPVYTEYSRSKGQGFFVGLKTAGKLLLHRVMR
ncbi:glycosyltransferase family 2 protein [Patescibacteria group bacterium]|nr:glycosyltransferase family 2 protein [Patescibacteria group bacterium]